MCATHATVAIKFSWFPKPPMSNSERILQFHLAAKRHANPELSSGFSLNEHTAEREEKNQLNIQITSH